VGISYTGQNGILSDRSSLVAKGRCTRAVSEDLAAVAGSKLAWPRLKESALRIVGLVL
jgi:hypothetical protein